MSKKHIAILLTALLTLACSVSGQLPTQAPAALVANSTANAPQTATGTPQRDVYALGRVWVRECPSTGCTPLGYIEAGGKVLVTGAVIDISHPDCKQWQGVEWRGGIGYVCAEWLAR